MDGIEFTPTSDPQSPTGVYIPHDIQDCFQELDRLLPAGLLTSIRGCDEADLTLQVFGLGLWLRNNWSLWSDQSRLKQYFDNLGVREADSASSLILAAYWRYLNGRPIELPRLMVYDKIARDEIRNGPKAGNLS
jgi:hypothetical protein